jgi:hypothetical protein
LGIDLGINGLTPNDAGDADAGPNRLQNSPVISAVLIGRSLTIDYSVASLPANAAYPLMIEFFLADSAGQEGQTFIRSVLYNLADATLSRRVALVAADAIVDGTKVVATATDAAGNTSEFSLAAITEVRQNPRHYFENGLDVNSDGFVLASDALAVVNYLNAFGPGFVSIDGVGPDYWDTTNDGQITPADALAVVNAINAGLGDGEGEAAIEDGSVVARATVTEELFAMWPDIDGLRSRSRKGS